MRPPRRAPGWGCVPGWGLVALLLGLAACRPAPPPPPSPGIDVVSYDARLHLDPEALRLRGSVRVEGRSLGDTVLWLDFDASPQRVAVGGRPVAVRRAGTRLGVPVPAGGRFAVDVTFAAKPRTGLYAAQAGGRRVVYTDAWPQRGRGWLPGVHHPADPARWRLTLTVPRGYRAVASGTPVAQDTLPGAVRFTWRLAAPAPAYALAFAVGPFTLVEQPAPGRPPLRYHLLDAAHARQLARTPQMLDYFEALLGPYAYASFATAEVPLGYAGMENAAAAFLQPGVFAQGTAEAVQVHEVAHQWFGNRVVPADWRDLWLSEGMATYLATLFYEHADGADTARAQRVRLARLDARRAATHRALVPAATRPPEALLTWVPYDKGACVLHLTRLTVGDAAFTAALRRVYAGAAPLSTAAWQAALEGAAGRSLAPLFEYWVYGTRLPTLTTRWDAASRRLSWRWDGDAGTLGAVPFELAVRQGARVRYVPAQARTVHLPGWEPTSPTVRPVGVLLRVEGPAGGA